MKGIVDVNSGEVKIGRGKMMLRSVAIGSCVVITAYDFKKKIGAMAHVMLPGSAPNGTSERTRYAADAIDELVNKMIQAGSKQCDIETYLVGAGNVLKKKDDTICKDNVTSITRLLERKHIPVRAMALGGTERKGVFLDVETGSISYMEGDGKEKPLWKSRGRTH